jgi:hypothetical protein
MRSNATAELNKIELDAIILWVKPSRCRTGRRITCLCFQGAVEMLLEAGCPWNLQDKDGYCAGSDILTLYRVRECVGSFAFSK